MAHKLPPWYMFRPQSCSPASISRRKAWLGALKLIGTIRDNDFPVHIPSEQLLFKYFPYSSLTGKQYLTESAEEDTNSSFKSAAFSLPWLGKEACLEQCAPDPGTECDKWVPGDWCGHQTLGSFGASRASDKRLVSSIDGPCGPFASPEGHSRAMKIRCFFFFFSPLSTHPSCLPWYFLSVPWEICVFVDLSPALLLWAYQGKDPFNFQKPCLSINCFCSVLEGALPPSSPSRHSLCEGSVSHYLSWPLVQSSFHPLLGLFLSWFARPHPRSIIGSILPSTCACPLIQPWWFPCTLHQGSLNWKCCPCSHQTSTSANLPLNPPTLPLWGDQAWEANGLHSSTGLPRWFSSKESTCQCRRHWFNPWVGKSPWRRKWQPTSVVLPGKSHGQSSLAGYSPWGPKESDTTEQLNHNKSSTAWAGIVHLLGSSTLLGKLDRYAACPGGLTTK